MTITITQQSRTSDALAEAGFLSPAEQVTLAKLAAHKTALERYFVERSDIIDAMFCAKLAKAHVILIGPPGTAKSYLIVGFTRGFEGDQFFAWQVTKFSTPEELFGPYSLAELKKGNYKRVTTNKLPEAHVAYLDEVFNANSSILNALNSAMNERIFEGQSIPLESIYGATNFIPEESVLVAFFDRFLFRFIVDPIHEERAFATMLKCGPFQADPANVVTRGEMTALRTKLPKVDASAILAPLVRLWQLLKAEGIFVSDRRFKWALDAVRARALLSGRGACVEDDLLLLRHVLWSDKKEIPIADITIMKAVSPIMARIKDYTDQAKDIETKLQATNPDKVPEDMVKVTEGLAKLKEIALAIKTTMRENVMQPKVQDLAERILKQVQEKRKKILATKLNIGPEDE